MYRVRPWALTSTGPRPGIVADEIFTDAFEVLVLVAAELDVGVLVLELEVGELVVLEELPLCGLEVSGLPELGWI
jgi:hypothetical protein